MIAICDPIVCEAILHFPTSPQFLYTDCASLAVVPVCASTTSAAKFRTLTTGPGLLAQRRRRRQGGGSHVAPIGPSFYHSLFLTAMLVIKSIPHLGFLTPFHFSYFPNLF